MAPEVVARRELNQSRFKRLIDPKVRIVAAELADVSANRLLAQSIRRAHFTHRPAPLVRGGSVQEGSMPSRARSHVILLRAGQASRRRATGSRRTAVYIDAAAVDGPSPRCSAFYLLGAGLAVGAGAELGRGQAPAPAGASEDMQIVASGDLAHHRRAARGTRSTPWPASPADAVMASQRRERETAASRHQMTVAGESPRTPAPAADSGLRPGRRHESSARWAATTTTCSAARQPRRAAGQRPAARRAGRDGHGMAPSSRPSRRRRSGAILRRSTCCSGDLRRGLYVTVLLACRPELSLPGDRPATRRCCWRARCRSAAPCARASPWASTRGRSSTAR
jgi:hypothetical protein